MFFLQQIRTNTEVYNQSARDTLEYTVLSEMSSSNPSPKCSRNATEEKTEELGRQRAMRMPGEQGPLRQLSIGHMNSTEAEAAITKAYMGLPCLMNVFYRVHFRTLMGLLNV